METTGMVADKRTARGEVLVGLGAGIAFLAAAQMAAPGRILEGYSRAGVLAFSALQGVVVVGLAMATVGRPVFVASLRCQGRPTRAAVVGMLSVACLCVLLPLASWFDEGVLKAFVRVDWPTAVHCALCSIVGCIPVWLGEVRRHTFPTPPGS